MDDRPPLDTSEIASAMRPAGGLERVEVRDGDLYVELRATAGTLHQVTVRAEDLLAIDARELGGPSEGDPNRTVATWLVVMIEEEVDSSRRSPGSFTFDPT